MKEGTQAGASGEERELECIEQPHCVACGEGGETALEGLEDRLFGVPGLWSISSCSRLGCGTAWLNPRPVDADLSSRELNASLSSHWKKPQPQAALVPGWPRSSSKILTAP